MKCCKECQLAIEDEFCCKLMDDYYHEKCMKCSLCDVGLDASCFPRNGRLFCLSCYKSIRSTCLKCSLKINEGEKVHKIYGAAIHDTCFACSVCSIKIQSGQQFQLVDFQLYCRQHPYQEPDDEKFTESSGSPGPSDLGDFEKPCDRTDTKVTFKQTTTDIFTFFIRQSDAGHGQQLKRSSWTR